MRGNDGSKDPPHDALVSQRPHSPPHSGIHRINPAIGQRNRKDQFVTTRCGPAGKRIGKETRDPFRLIYQSTRNSYVKIADFGKAIIDTGESNRLLPCERAAA